ncbi:MAG: hypothetical protein QXN37_01460 [Candidatus Anstonellaceae archaeon]
MLLELCKSTREFFKDNLNKAFVAVALVLGIAAYILQPYAATLPSQAQNETFYHFFYLSSCPHCHEQMNYLHPLLQEKFNVSIAYHEVSMPTQNEIFEKVRTSFGLPASVPVTLVGNKVFSGYSPQIGANIIEEVKECTKNGCPDPLVNLSAQLKQSQHIYEIPLLGQVDGKTASLPLLAVVLGLIDGFNPCAMWVLVYLISLTMTLNDKKRVFMIVGSFVFASGVLYFLFMTAWLNAFLFVGYARPVTILIGMVALVGGAISLRQYIESSKDGLTCKVGSPQEHAKIAAKAKSIASAPITISLLFSIIALAFVVNSVEFVCSSAIPAVFTQILALQNLSFLEYYGYILLYDLFFMADDLVIFGMAALAISGTVGERYARWCKLAGGALLIFLGLLLLFTPRILW